MVEERRRDRRSGGETEGAAVGRATRVEGGDAMVEERRRDGGRATERQNERRGDSEGENWMSGESETENRV